MRQEAPRTFLQKPETATYSEYGNTILAHWPDSSSTDRDRALQTLDVSKEHFKVLVSRLRKRFREKIRSQIAQTVASEEEIAAELDYLIRVLRQPVSKE